MDIDAMFKMFTKGMQVERARHQMTLGGVIKRLGELPEGAWVKVSGDLHSYRGFYEDLSLGSDDQEACLPALSLLAECKEAVGKPFEGYKGGNFVMDHNTPVWIAKYGSLGKRLVAINDDGTLVTKEDE